MTSSTAAYSSVEAICNAALARIGYPESISQIREGTRHARVAIRLYGQTRDALLKARSWQFAQREAALVTTAFTVSPWAYEYSLPSDFLMVRNVLPTPVPSPDFNPFSVLFTIYNDPRNTPNTQVLLTNQASATLLYTAQITDMTQWEPGFMDALVAALAERFAPALAAPMLPSMARLADEAEGIAVGATDLQPPVDVPAPGRSAQ